VLPFNHILQDYSLIVNTLFDVYLSLAIIVALSVNNREHAEWWRASNLDKAAKKEIFAKQLDSIVIFCIHCTPSAYLITEINRELDGKPKTQAFGRYNNSNTDNNWRTNISC
jgi:hypothetical protein